MTEEARPGPNPWLYRSQPLQERIIERTTLPAVLDTYRAQAEGERPALTGYRDGIRVGHWSYYDLNWAVRRTGAELAASHGVGRGDRVIVMSSNCTEIYLVHLAVMSIGAVVVPVGNLESARTLAFITSHVRASLFVEGEGVPNDLHAVIALPRVSAHSLLASAHSRDPVDALHDRVGPDDLAVILFTSGTTSVPKGVCLSHYNLLVNAEALRRAHALERNRNHLCILPLYHANAFGFSMIGSVYAGCHVILCNRFAGPDLWAIARDESVNILSAVPEILRALASRRFALPLPELRYVVSAAAPLSSSVARAFEATTGIPVHQGYGLSECTNFAATTPADIDSEVRARLVDEWRVPSIGPAVFGTEVEILLPDGSRAEALTEGEVAVSGHNVMSGYWEAPTETAAVFAHGWLHTGDLGFFVELKGERYFFITGRLKEIIIRHGETISPRAVEEEIAELGDLGRYAVCGFPNEAAGEEIGVYIQVSDPERALAETRAILAQCSPRYRPRVAIIGSAAVPATVTGKVQRKRLATRFAAFARTQFGGAPRVVRHDEKLDGAYAEVVDPHAFEDHGAATRSAGRVEQPR